jgi:hypothetical protein
MQAAIFFALQAPARGGGLGYGSGLPGRLQLMAHSLAHGLAKTGGKHCPALPPAFKRGQGNGHAAAKGRATNARLYTAVYSPKFFRYFTGLWQLTI